MSSSIGSLFSSVFLYLRSLLFSKHLEICVVGLQAAGKTSLVNLLSSGQFADEMVPTVGFNMRKVRSGNTTIKVWDIGGQPRFRSVPLLVLATKNDIKGAARVDDVIRVLKLDTIANREVSCYSISSKNQVNIDVTLKWLVARSPVGQR
ncbi:hypothetical protein NDA13_003031 [Ustilago tritici]|nr:hypothetical protein NDA13_003031 [Ustilago tritici]